MFEVDSADTCGGNFSLVSMGRRAEGLVSADLGARNPIGARGIFLFNIPRQLSFLDISLEILILHVEGGL
jgi:hypothetical protein